MPAWLPTFSFSMPFKLMVDGVEVVQVVQVCQHDLTTHLFFDAFQINGSINLKLAWCDYPSDDMTVFLILPDVSHSHTLTLTSHFIRFLTTILDLKCKLTLSTVCSSANPVQPGSL